MSRLLVIAPYQGLKDLFLEVNQELNKHLHVEVGNLYKGLAVAKKLEDKGFDVIISRGATARLLREHCRLPVVEIGISGYDILRTLALVKGFPGKIGLMSYLNTIQGADAIGSLLEMDLTFFLIEKEQEIEAAIHQALANEIEVIIGDVISTATAEKFGLKAILINSGKEAVIEAINEAEHIAYYTKKEKERRHFLEALLNSLQEGVIAVDRKGCILALNAKAENEMDIHKDFVIGKKLSEIPALCDLLPLYEQDPSPSEQLLNVNGEEFIISKTTVRWDKDLEADVLLFQKASSIRNVQHRIRLQQSLEERRAHIHFNHLVANSPGMKEVLEKAKGFSADDLPVLLYGERGTGKQSLAQAVHNASERRTGPFVYVQCQMFDEERLAMELFGSPESPDKQGALGLAQGGTLYIDSIENMPLSLQERFVRWLKVDGGKSSGSPHSAAVPSVRLIASSIQELSRLVSEGRFLKSLHDVFRGRELSVPPLRERLQDIDDLVRWFIAFFNPKNGKQIVGCHPLVLKRLKQLHWPENVSELKRIVEKMCEAASGPIIEEREAESVLLEMIAEKGIAVPSRHLDITGKTLEQIEREVIQLVMQEEGYNQSQAAKRLGINRSTLWRKTKNMLRNR